MVRAALLLVVLSVVACSSSGKKDEVPIPSPEMKTAQEVGPLEWPFEAPEVPEITEGESLDDESFWDNFYDDEDGQFDMSDWLAQPAGFFPLAIPITEPAVGYGLAVGLLFFHPNESEDDDPDAPRSPPSISAAFGGATSNGTWMVGGGHMGIWDDDNIRYTGGLAVFSVNLEFEGLGGVFLPGRASVDYTLGGWALLQGIKFRIPSTDLFLGATYTFIDFDNEFEFKFDKVNLPKTETTARASGLGAVAQYDSRDNIFTPTRGQYIDGQFKWFGEPIGSDDTYGIVDATWAAWTPLFPGLDLGARVQYGWASDRTPFYMMPFIQMRGVPAMRYLGNYAASIELEPRILLTERWALVVFGGVGRVGLTAEQFLDGDNVYAGGTGFRYLIARKLGIFAGCDIAFSEDTTAIYVTFGTAWTGL